ncbi:MAG: hypothetical protein ABW061_25345 [Polyangiaceae bacterium]
MNVGWSWIVGRAGCFAFASLACCGGVAALPGGDGEGRGGGASIAGASGAAGMGSSGASDSAGYLGPITAGGCRKNPLATPWPVISGCGSGGLPRCPHPSQASSASYGPFVACCPPSSPYSCNNGTPNSCFETAARAFARCGEACVECTQL